MTERFDDRLLIACGLAWGAGLLHAIAAVEHVGDRPATVSLALVLCAALFAWTAVAYRMPRRGVLAIGIALGAAVLALWIAANPARATAAAFGPLSQTAVLCRLFPGGLPLSGAQWTPSAVGTLVSIADADVLVLVALVAVTLAEAHRRLRRAASVLLGGAGGVLILLSCVSLAMAGGMQM